MEDSLTFSINLLLHILLIAFCHKGYVHNDDKTVIAAFVDVAE